MDAERRPRPGRPRPPRRRRARRPDDAVDAKQQLDHLCGAFGGLSDSHHEILVLREFEGLSYREIGDRMGLSRPGVESTLFRARKRLAEEYDELVSGQRCVRIQSIIAAAGGAALGTRDQRRLARHVSHCQPCRRMALAAGLDVTSLPRTPVRRAVDRVAGVPAAPGLPALALLAGSEQMVPCPSRWPPRGRRPWRSPRRCSSPASARASPRTCGGKPPALKAGQGQAGRPSRRRPRRAGSSTRARRPLRAPRRRRSATKVKATVRRRQAQLVRASASRNARGAARAAPRRRSAPATTPSKPPRRAPAAANPVEQLVDPEPAQGRRRPTAPSAPRLQLPQVAAAGRSTRASARTPGRRPGQPGRPGHDADRERHGRHRRGHGRQGDGRPAERPRLSRPWRRADAGSFVESLMDTNLYSIGAYFHDRHPELVDSVVDEAAGDRARRPRGATRRPATSRSRPPSRRSSPGLAVRYYRAVNG